MQSETVRCPACCAWWTLTHEPAAVPSRGARQILTCSCTYVLLWFDAADRVRRRPVAWADERPPDLGHIRDLPHDGPIVGGRSLDLATGIVRRNRTG
jgi:hypothetical protein